MIELIVGVLWTYLCISLGVGTEVYLHERVHNEETRGNARKESIKSMLYWPKQLFTYSK